MKKLLLLCIVMIATLPLSAQSNAGGTSGSAAKSAVDALPADAPTRDQVMTFLDLMQTRRTMLTLLDGMKKAMAQGAEDDLRRKIPNPTPKQIDGVHQIIDAAMDDMPLDEMLNAVVTVYQRHFSKSDIEELIRFYSSPVGQKVLREQPQLMQESMQAGADIQRKRYDEIMLKIQKKTQQLMDEEDKPAPAKK